MNIETMIYIALALHGILVCCLILVLCKIAQWTANQNKILLAIHKILESKTIGNR
jgi:hypothetical protein